MSDDPRDEIIKQFYKPCRCDHSFYEACCGNDYATQRALADEIMRLRQEREELEGELSLSGLAREELSKRLAAVEAERDAMEGMYRHHVGVALDAIAKLNHAQATVSTLQEQLTHQTITLTAEHQRAERILAALREPSEAVLQAAGHEVLRYVDPNEGDMRSAIIAAVAAAEQEVNNER